MTTTTGTPPPVPEAAGLYYAQSQYRSAQAFRAKYDLVVKIRGAKPFLSCVGFDLQKWQIIPNITIDKIRAWGPRLERPFVYTPGIDGPKRG